MTHPCRAALVQAWEGVPAAGLGHPTPGNAPEPLPRRTQAQGGRTALPSGPCLGAVPGTTDRWGGPARPGRARLPTAVPLSAQSSRIDDQRCPPPDGLPRGPTMPDEDFFSLIQRVQAKRMDEQRVDLAGSPEQEMGGPPEPRQQCQPGAS